MTYVVCQITRWVDDEPQPGIVEAILEDRTGTQWRFIDKWPWFLFGLEDLEFPKNGVIRCSVLDQYFDQSGRSIFQISTEIPAQTWAVDGDQFVFEVFQEQLVNLGN
jgi:hypothetical protein